MARKPLKPLKSIKSEKKDLKILSRGVISKRFPVTNFIDSSVGSGLLGIGLLEARPQIVSNFDDKELNKLGKPINIPSTVPLYDYFFVTQKNPSIATDEDSQYFFYVVKTLKSISLSDFSQIIGISVSNISPLSQSEYENGSFNHPSYINQNYEKISIRYSEVSLLPQKTPGRLDDVPIGYPDFNYNPSPISTAVGVIPSAPYPGFYVDGYDKGATGITLGTGGVLNFIDGSVKTPPQVRPTSWSWDFPGGSPTGSTAQNPVVDYSSALSGSYTVTLNASNSSGTSTLTKTNYINKQ